jgi:hypothetical protein
MPPTAPYGNVLRSTSKPSPVVLKEAEADGYRRAKSGESADIGDDRSDAWRDAYMEGFTRGRLESQNMKPNMMKVSAAKRAGISDATAKKVMDQKYVNDSDAEVQEAYVDAYTKRREEVGGRRKTRKHKKKSRKTRRR